MVQQRFMYENKKIPAYLKVPYIRCVKEIGQETIACDSNQSTKTITLIMVFLIHSCGGPLEVGERLSHPNLGRQDSVTVP